MTVRDAPKRHAWDEPKRSADSPRPAGILLDAHAQAGQDLHEREARLRSQVSESEQIGDPFELYKAQHALGLHFETEGALDQAEESLRSAVEVCRGESALLRSMAAVSNDHGVVLARLGRRVEAEDSLASASEILQFEDLDPITLAAKRNRGLISWAGGKSSAALDLWNEVFRNARDRDDAEANAQILNNVSVLRLLDGEAEEALQLLSRAVLLAQRAGDLRGLACMYNNLGLIFSGPPRGDHVAAIPFVEMALALLSGAIDVLARLYVLNNNIIIYEQAHLEPARRFRRQFSDTLKAFPFSYPSRLADVERTIFSSDHSPVTVEDSADREWEISAHPALLCCCARSGVQE
jgi:tetratricopeptide (TPR) repeat protein